MKTTFAMSACSALLSRSLFLSVRLCSRASASTSLSCSCRCCLLLVLSATLDSASLPATQHHTAPHQPHHNQRERAATQHSKKKVTEPTFVVGSADIANVGDRQRDRPDRVGAAAA